MGARWIRRGLQVASCVCWVAVAASGRRGGPFQQQDQSQPQTQPPIFRAEHNEVEVVVTVRDRNGEPVSNLTQSEFEIRDNGKVQTISSFALQSATQQSATPQLAPTPSTAAT